MGSIQKISLFLFALLLAVIQQTAGAPLASSVLPTRAEISTAGDPTNHLHVEETGIEFDDLGNAPLTERRDEDTFLDIRGVDTGLDLRELEVALDARDPGKSSRKSWDKSQKAKKPASVPNQPAQPTKVQDTSKAQVTAPPKAPNGNGLCGRASGDCNTDIVTMTVMADFTPEQWDEIRKQQGS